MAPVLFEYVHEMFYTQCHRSSRFAPIAQVEYEAGVVSGEPAESGRRHVVPAQELFDFVDQHGGLLLANRCPRFVARDFLLV